jgi:hypothetical protein
MTHATKIGSPAFGALIIFSPFRNCSYEFIQDGAQILFTRLTKFALEQTIKPAICEVYQRNRNLFDTVITFATITNPHFFTFFFGASYFAP